MNTQLFSMGLPSYAVINTENGTTETAVSKNILSADDVCVEIREDADTCQIFLTADSTPVRWIKLRWKMNLPKRAHFYGDAWERGYGDLEWRGMSANRFMPWYFCAAGKDEIVCCGVKVRPSAMCFWQTDAAGVTLFMDVRCGGSGVKLKGRTLQAAQVVSARMQDCTSYEALNTFCGYMCEDPILPSFPVYGSNNWYYAYGKSSEEEILADCDYLLNLTKGFSNKPYMVIDDCWQEHHRLNEYNGGPWTKGNAKFPDMKGLAQKIAEKGARPGIWVRLLLNEDEQIPEEWRLSHNGCLDPSHPDALNYIIRDVKRICDWGYTLIKHDFSTFDLFGRWGFQMDPMVTDNGWHFYDESMTSAEVVLLLYREILHACKETGTLVLGCNTIGHLGAGYMHISRTGDDTSGTQWERTRRMGINSLAFRLHQHRKFYEVDADCVGIDGAVPWEFNKQWADLLAQSGSPLFVSARPGVLTESELEELSNFLKVASWQQNHVIPLDWEDTDCPKEWEDKEKGITRQYQWYEQSGTKFDEKPVRSAPYLSFAE